jgi:hypothetical protein
MNPGDRLQHGVRQQSRRTAMPHAVDPRRDTFLPRCGGRMPNALTEIADALGTTVGMIRVTSSMGSPASIPKPHLHRPNGDEKRSTPSSNGIRSFPGMCRDNHIREVLAIAGAMSPATAVTRAGRCCRAAK